MESDSDIPDEHWESVLDAVKAYVGSDEDLLVLNAVKAFVTSNEDKIVSASDENKLPQPTRDDISLPLAGRITSARKTKEPSVVSEYGSTPDLTIDSFRLCSDDLEVMRNTSEELQAIMNVLMDNLPKVLSETVLLAEEEKAVREMAVAELEVVRNRWKTDVEALTGIINKKNETIANLQKLVYPTSRVATNIDPSEVARKLAEAESEIDRLHELIESQHSAR